MLKKKYPNYYKSVKTPEFIADKLEKFKSAALLWNDAKKLSFISCAACKLNDTLLLPTELLVKKLEFLFNEKYENEIKVEQIINFINKHRQKFRKSSKIC
jgi:hypothetical protein